MLRIGLPIFKLDGTLITTGTGSGYVSADDGAAAAIVPTFVAANSGSWVLDLSAAQMNGKKISGYITSDAAGSLPTPFVIYTKACAAIHSGTARVVGGPTTSQIQLATTASDEDDGYNNCLVGITGNTGVGAIRRITDYVGSTRMATLDAAWGTAPDATSTYEILPTSESVNMAGGVDVGESLSAIKIVTDKIGSASMLEEVP
jgi:hypothetical protein